MIRLEQVAGRLQLRDDSPGAPGPLWCDLLSPAMTSRVRQGRRGLLARAVGLKPGRPAPDCIDATAGLGGDAWLLAALGCPVIAIERHPLVAALIADGLERAGRTAPEIRVRITLVQTDAIEALPAMAARVVLLDPMFGPHRGGRPRKAAQYLQALIGEPADTGALFAAACRAARRVVVKRPRHGPPLVDDPAPSHTQRGKAVRFDIYLL